MAEDASEQRVTRKRRSTDVAPTTLALAALASVVATAIVSRFGLESTLVGAALTPVVVTVVREFGRRPVAQVGAITSAAGNWRHWRHQQAGAPPDEPEAAPPPRPVPPAPHRGRIRWAVVGSASVVGFLAAVAFFTVPDLIAGQSLVADRDSTFFSSRDSGPKEPVTAPTATTTTETTEETATTPTTTAPETQTETVTVTSTTPATTAPPPDPAAPVTPTPPSATPTP